MLNKFFKEWNESVLNKTIIETTDTHITSKFMFRNTEFHVTVHKEKQEGGPSELAFFVPLTKKFVESKCFTNYADLANSIKLAMTQGTEYEDRRLQRQEQKRRKAINELTLERTRAVAGLRMTPELTDWILKRFHKNLKDGINPKFDNVVLENLLQVQDVIFGSDIENPEVRSKFVFCVYDIACNCMLSAFSTKINMRSMSISRMNEYFLKPLESTVKCGAHVRKARMFVTELYDLHNRHPSAFLYFMEFLQDLYAEYTTVSVTRRCAELVAQRMRRHTRRFSPIDTNTNRHTTTVKPLGTLSELLGADMTFKL